MFGLFDTDDDGDLSILEAATGLAGAKIVKEVVMPTPEDKKQSLGEDIVDVAIGAVLLGSLF